MPHFVVILEVIPGVQSTQEQRQSHLNHLASLKSRGILYAAGRFKDGTGGLYIIEAKDLDEANAIASSDPYVKLGLRKCTVKEWERTY